MVADESETAEAIETETIGATEQSVWSSYAQAHQVMIADPATLEVLQGVPVVHLVEEPEDTSQLDADLLQAENEVLAEEVLAEEPLEEGWEDPQIPVAAEVMMQEAARAVSTQSGSPSGIEQQDCFEMEAVLLAAAAVEAAAPGTIGSGLEEETEAQDESPAVAALAGSDLTPLPFADFAEVAGRLSSGDTGAWDCLSAWLRSEAR